jgi:hypothetical protein
MDFVQKEILHDYQGALEDIDNADVLESNTTITLRSCEISKRFRV